MEVILTVENLSKSYGRGCQHCTSFTGPEYETNICPYCKTVIAVQNVSFKLYKGEILG